MIEAERYLAKKLQPQEPSPCPSSGPTHAKTGATAGQPANRQTVAVNTASGTSNPQRGGWMKYVVATIAAVGILFAYAIIGALLNWRNAGGAFPQVLLWAAIVTTWITIVNKWQASPRKQ
jgi:hypothetical protein